MRSRWPQCLCPAARLLRARSYQGTADGTRAEPADPATAAFAAPDADPAGAVRDAAGVAAADAELAGRDDEDRAAADPVPAVWEPAPVAGLDDCRAGPR